MQDDLGDGQSNGGNVRRTGWELVCSHVGEVVGKGDWWSDSENV